MCDAFPPHCIFLVWCPECHSIVLGHYVALAIILWKRWSNLLSLFMEFTCLFSILILSTSDIIFKKHVWHEIWLSCHFINFAPSYHLPWYAGWFDCMDLPSWQIWNFSVCPVIVCLQHCCSRCTCWQVCWALNGEETPQMPRYIQPEISLWLDIFPYKRNVHRNLLKRNSSVRH